MPYYEPFTNVLSDMASKRQSVEKGAQDLEKGRLEIDAYKKATQEKEDYAKSVKDILSEQATSNTPEDTRQPLPGDQKTSPSGSPMPSFMGGAKEEAAAKGDSPQDEWTGKLKDLQSQGQAKQKQQQQHSQQLQKLMMAAANNNNPALALDFRKQLDGLDDKMKESQSENIKLAGQQYETQAQLGQGYLNNPTDEGWYKTVAESMRLGLPGAEGLFNVPREKREAVAKAAIAQGLTANQQIKAQQAVSNAVAKAEITKKRQEYFDYKRIMDDRKQSFRERSQTAKDAYESSKHDATKTKDYIATVQTQVKNSEDSVKTLETERKGILGRIEKLDTSIEVGMTQEQSDAKREALADQLKQVEGDLTTGQADLNSLKNEYRTIAKGAGVKPASSGADFNKEAAKLSGGNEDYKMYVKLFDAAKGDKVEQKRLTELARSHGLLK